MSSFNKRALLRIRITCMMGRPSLKSCSMIPITQYVMMATWICMRTAFSDSPQKVLTFRCCFIHLKNLWEALHNYFKWLKQHLKIKRFWGTTKNAVRIQISVAIITYCLVAIVHHDMQLKRSTYEVLQILSISLTDKTRLRDLFDKTIFNDVKELDYPLFKGLFD